MIIQSSKTYVHAIGLSCCFRQWRADSHCRFLHGYALQVKIIFGSSSLDKNGWVMDFGGLKSFRLWLEQTFDHKTLVAIDDPEMIRFQELQARQIIQMKVVPGVGCEAFAQMIFTECQDWLDRTRLVDQRKADVPPTDHRDVWVESVEVREHEANSAIARKS